MKLSMVCSMGIGLLFLSACSLAADVTPPPGMESVSTEPVPTEAISDSQPMPDQFDLVTGQKIYLEKCEPCHGIDGKGNGSLAANLTNPSPEIGSAEVMRSSIPSEWYQILTEGRMDRQMPPFTSLSEEQRWDVLAYIYSLGMHRERLLLAEELFSENCASCHGETGRGDGPMAESIEKAPANFMDFSSGTDRSLERSFQAIASGLAPGMPAFQETFNEDEIWMLAEYVQALLFNPALSSGILEQADSTNELADASQDAIVDAASDVADTLRSKELEPTGVISGTVTNATGGVIPAGIEILLHGFDEMQMVLTETVKLAEDGVFVFDQLSLKPARAFIASIDFEGVSYASNVAVAEEGVKSLQLPLEVYESTSDPSGLTIDRLHVFFEPVDERIIRVIELYVISNAGNKAVVAPNQDEPVLNIAIPPNAAGLEFREGELGMRFVPTQDGFGDLAVIRPGMASHQVVFTYELPFDRKLVFGHPVDLPVNAVVVLIPEDSLKVKGDSLQDAGTRTSEGFTYRTYNGSELAGGAQLEMEISQRSNFSRPVLASGSSAGVALGLVVLAVTLIAAGVWSYRRSRIPELAAIPEQAKPVSNFEDTQDSLMDAILALDDQYKAGNIQADAYQERRLELKERLRKLLK